MDVRYLTEARLQKGIRVILRADLDVGVKNGRVADDMRIRAGLPTIRYLLGHDARIRIVGYLGRPGGIRNPKFTLAPVSRLLSVLLKKKVVFLKDPFGERTMRAYSDSRDIILFENIRFWKEEVDNDIQFARMIASWGDCYVNDAFANAHRREASLVVVPALLPAYAGLRLKEEITALEKIITRPKRPLVAVLGGAKIETKLPLIRRFLKDADRVLVGGALANTIFSLMDRSVGKSRIDPDTKVGAAIFRKRNLLLPSDVVVTRALTARAAHALRDIREVRPDEYIVDIGPQTRSRFITALKDARTVVWNGPMGLVEIPEYREGTKAIARAMRISPAFTVVGGGDTIAVLRSLRLDKGFDHTSTGGGAMLAFLSGKKLPGIEALKQYKA